MRELQFPEKELILTFSKLGIKNFTYTNGSNDSTFFEEAGIPTVIFGAGNEEACHIANEYVNINNIEKTKEIYLKICKMISYK